MNKRGRNLLIYNGVFLQVSLLLCMSFAIAFIWNAGMGSAQYMDFSTVQPGTTLWASDGTSITKLASGGWQTGTGTTYNIVPTDWESKYLLTSNPNPVATVTNPTPALPDYAATPPPGTPAANPMGPSGQGTAGGLTTTPAPTVATNIPKGAIPLDNGYYYTVDKNGAIQVFRPDGTLVSNTANTGSSALGQWWGSSATNSFWSSLVTSLVYGLIAFGLAKMVTNMLGLPPGEANAISYAAGAGVFAASFVSQYWTGGSLVSNTFTYLKTTPFETLSWAGFIVGLIVAAVVYMWQYKKVTEYIYTYTCKPWQAPTGGAHCEDCNKDPMKPCSEYRCRSLGQACEIVNEGTAKEACVWVNPRDVTSPTITPWKEALKPNELKYTNDATRPISRGVRIVNGDNGCLKAYTPLQFGIITNEPAQCKIDYNHTGNFSNMQFDFGESNYFEYNHTQAMLLPNAEINSTTGDPLSPYIQNDGTMNLYIRCMDKNGNQNVDEYVVSFCVDKSPDTTPPLIINTSIPSGGYVQYQIGSAPISVYTNEWADCRWSITDQAYDTMENNMSCPGSPAEINAAMTYTCSGNFSGILDRQDNSYYIRCKDQPDQNESVRNVNTQSYNLVLKGSQPLNILTVSPNATVYGSTTTVKTTLSVTTDDGAQEGGAYCAFSTTGDEGDYVLMANTGFNVHQHTQDLQLPSGSYTYYFRCVDAGGNTKEARTSFNVVVDQEPPAVTRVYKENGLKIITNEDAECVYSLNNCNYDFAAGLAMQYSNPSIKTALYAELKANSVYYIKCKDGYGNQPGPNECSIIVNGA